MNSLDCGFQFGWLEPERAALALVRDSPLGIDEIEPIRPSCISAFCHVVEFVDHCGNLNSESIYACAGEGDTLSVISRAGKNQILFHIVLCLPNIARMSFQDVDDQECDMIAVLLIKAV